MPVNENSKVMILTHGLYPIPGYTVSGNGIRAWGLAMGLVHNGFEVVYSTPKDTVHPHTPRPEVVLAPYSDKAELHALIKTHTPGVLIVGYWAYMHLIPWDMDIPVVMDLLAPWLLEAEFQDECGMDIKISDYVNCLSKADYFLCCTNRQKAFHTSWLIMSGFGCRDNIIDVIPISADPELPVRPPCLPDKKIVFLYGGVLWPWRSPQEWISVLLNILAENGKGRLSLITGNYPLDESSSSGTLHLPRGDRYDAVLEQSDLLAYDEMERFFLQADVGIELSGKNAERELSFSFRIIEYLRCGLPVICNDFLEIADLIKEYDAGWVLDSGDENALENVVNRILSGEENLKEKSGNASRLIRKKFNCLENIEPLALFCRTPFKREKINPSLSAKIQEQDGLLEEQKKIIHHLREQIEVGEENHQKEIASHEKAHAELLYYLKEYRMQLLQWQVIADERRLSVRLKQIKKRILSFLKNDSEPFETCLFEASKKNIKVNLMQLCAGLPLTPLPELLKKGHLPLDHQQKPIERFLSHVDVHGKRVLEIGADDAVILSIFEKKGMSLGVGVNNWYWTDNNPKTVKVSEKIILSYGDVTSLPFEDASFDIIFTVAAFEHIHGLDAALREMHRLLKPGGVVYSFYGPIWSSAVGHHLWFERKGQWYCFTERETTLPVLADYEHLLLDRNEMAEKLRRTWDQEAVDDFIYQIYDNDQINRYLYADYLEMFNNSDFEIEFLEHDSTTPIEADLKEILSSKYGKENDFTVIILEVLLKKKGNLTDGFIPGSLTRVCRQLNRQSFLSFMHKIIKRVSGYIGLFYRGVVKRLLVPLWQRFEKKNNLAIVTRADVFPVEHGAAAKIYHTARVLSYEYDEVYLVTSDRCKFYVFNQGQFYEEYYPRLLRELCYPSEAVLRKKSTHFGIPEKESFLFFPKLDMNFKLRVLYVALQKRICIYQAEFPSFIDACSWACRIFGGKRSIVEHNIEFERIAHTYNLSDGISNYMKNYEIKLCNSVDHVITVSQNDTRGLIDAGVSEDKIFMIPHGVDLENFEMGATDSVALRKLYGISPEDIVLIFHGIYLYEPNARAAVLIGEKILPALNARGYHPKCLAVGKYPPEETNHPDLIYTDAVEHVAPYINAADIAVVPLQDGGGTRMKILEYFAASVPVVATSKGAEGIDVVPGKAIIIEDDMDKLVDEIIQLIEEPNRRERIGREGRKFVEQFDWRNIGKRYVELYRR